MNEARLRKELAACSRRVWERGWVANHDGNLSARLPRQRLMCTPTAVSKAEITPEMVLVLDAAGKVLSGSGRPFSELNLHLAWLQARPDVGAVLHAHPPCATGMGAAGVGLDRPFLPEAVVSLGPCVPAVPLALPGGDAAAAVAPYLDEYDALILCGNGVLTCGPDLETAYLRMELVEHLARVAGAASAFGGVTPLPAQMLQHLLAARSRAGLGPEARGLPTTLPDLQPGGPNRRHELSALVREEIRRVLDR